MKKTPLPQKALPTPKRGSFLYVFCAFAVVCIWVVWHSVTFSLPVPSEPPKLYSNPSREDLRLTILNAIDHARASVFLSMFGLSDPSILRALNSKIKAQIPVTIYYDVKGSPDIRKTLSGARIHPILQAGIMHQKILILDEETVFLGSANFTTQSLKMHDNLVVGLANQKIARFLKERVPHSTGYLRTLVGGQDVEIWLLPDPKGHALTDLRKQIKQAKRTLRIALFTLTHPSLIEEVIKAKKRGVDVSVVIDMHSALGASADAIETLKKADVRVLYSQGVQLMHHKFVYIDEQTLVSGSANWTKSAFAKNSDCILILHNLNREQKSFMNSLWRRIETATQKQVKLDKMSL